MSYRPEHHLSARFARRLGESRVASPNERAVLASLWETPGLARSSLSHAVDLSQQSLHRIVNRLNDRGMIEIGASAPPTHKGKPSPQLSLNPRFACSIGVSINTDSAEIAVMNFAGESVSVALGIEGMSLRQVLEQLDEATARLMGQMGFTRRKVFGVGFAISGYVVDGTKYNAPEPLAEWSMFDLAPFLAEYFGHPVWTENGANTSTLCEQMFGYGRDYRTFAYLSFNYGFGGGIVMDGRLMRGGFGNAGELSGMFAPGEHEDRPRLRSLLEMLRAEGVEVETIRDLSDWFDPAWPGVDGWIERVQPYMDRVINALGAVIDPEAVVFGGQLPRPLAERLIASSQFYTHRPRHGAMRRMARLVPSELEGQTSAKGAAILPLKASVF